MELNDHSTSLQFVPSNGPPPGAHPAEARSDTAMSTPATRALEVRSMVASLRFRTTRFTTDPAQYASSPDTLPLKTL